MFNWKLVLASLALFTFVGLPAIGQEMNVPSLKKLDLLAWSSEVMMSKENVPHIENPAVNIAEEVGEFSELKEGIHKLGRISMASEKEEEPHHSIAGEPEPEEEGFLHFLRNIFSSAMNF
ncbi:MAG: hypothetical protein AAB383_02220 [Patescibacteria group bacterium]